MTVENIYIDTSIFEANNFLESKRINEILKLSRNGYVNIILPELTYKEILNRARKNCREAVKSFNQTRNEFRILRNIPEYKLRFDTVNKNFSLEKLEERIIDVFKDSKITIIDYPTVNIKTVFDSYFEQKPPFKEGLKKDEFPDAFALLSIETWCKENGKKCLVLSKDNDLINYQGENVDHVIFETFLDNKLRQIEKENKKKLRIKKLEESFADRLGILQSEIADWVKEQLDDESIYNEMTNYHGILNVDVIETSAELNKDDFQITSINDNGITIQTEVTVDYQVEIEYNDGDSAYFDDEDRVWNYIETKNETIVDIQWFPVELKFDFPLAGDEYAELEIEQINSGKNLKI
jgi:hypothetical protein